jgi:hypothetical protein
MLPVAKLPIQRRVERVLDRQLPLGWPERGAFIRGNTLNAADHQAKRDEKRTTHGNLREKLKS